MSAFFVELCGRELEQWKSDGNWNDQYNKWQDECEQKLKDKYGNNSSDLLEKNKNLVEKNQELEKKIESQFSSGTTAGIGAAAGGAGIALGVSGVTLIPVLVKGIIKLFI